MKALAIGGGGLLATFLMIFLPVLLDNLVLGFAAALAVIGLSAVKRKYSFMWGQIIAVGFIVLFVVFGPFIF